MREKNTGFTIVEVIIGTAFLGVILTSILSILTVLQKGSIDAIAMVNSQATARIIIEKIVRPIRHWSGFDLVDEGNKLIRASDSLAVDTFIFDNGDGDDATFSDNKILKNGNVIATNIIRIQGKEIFKGIKPNELLEINFGVKNQGVLGHYKEVHISTEVKLRN